MSMTDDMALVKLHKKFWKPSVPEEFCILCIVILRPWVIALLSRSEALDIGPGLIGLFLSCPNKEVVSLPWIGVTGPGRVCCLAMDGAADILFAIAHSIPRAIWLVSGLVSGKTLHTDFLLWPPSNLVVRPTASSERKGLDRPRSSPVRQHVRWRSWKKQGTVV